MGFKVSIKGKSGDAQLAFFSITKPRVQVKDFTIEIKYVKSDKSRGNMKINHNDPDLMIDVTDPLKFIVIEDAEGI